MRRSQRTTVSGLPVPTYPFDEVGGLVFGNFHPEQSEARAFFVSHSLGQASVRFLPVYFKHFLKMLNPGYERLVNL